MDSVVWLPVIVCVLAVLYLWTNRAKKGKNERIIPTFPSIPPYLGLMLSYLPLPDLVTKMVKKHPGKALMTLAKMKGPVFKLNSSGFTFVVANGYPAIKEVLSVKGTDYAGRFCEPKQLSVNPKRLGILEGKYCDEWKTRRATCLGILKSFGFGKRRFENRILEEIQYTLNVVDSEKEKPFCIGRLIETSVANIICSMVFGERYDHTDKQLAYLKKATNGVLEWFTDRPYGTLNPDFQWLSSVKMSRERYAIAHRKLTDFCHRHIVEHQKTFDEENLRDFIDAYIKIMKEREDPSFNVEQLTFLLYELFIAGAETTAVTLQWFVLYMVNNPTVQDKVRNEILSIVGQDRIPSLNDRESMPYTEAVLREVLRISPVLPIAPFHLTLKDTTLMGYPVPAGTPIALNLYSVLNDPDTFPNPDVFNPDRFIDCQTGDLILSEHLVQFGAGSRSCMGQQLAKQELFLFTTCILQRFILTTPPGVDKLPEDSMWTTTFKPAKPFRICARQCTQRGNTIGKLVQD